MLFLEFDVSVDVSRTASDRCYEDAVIHNWPDNVIKHIARAVDVNGSPGIRLDFKPVVIQM